TTRQKRRPPILPWATLRRLTPMGFLPWCGNATGVRPPRFLKHVLQLPLVLPVGRIIWQVHHLRSTAGATAISRLALSLPGAKLVNRLAFSQALAALPAIATPLARLMGPNICRRDDNSGKLSTWKWRNTPSSCKHPPPGKG